MTLDTLHQLRSGRLTGVRQLYLRNCGLTAFPPEVFQLADSLEILDLSGNQLSALPDDLHRLKRLQTIFCSDNPFTELPVALGLCKRLDMVGFKANRIVNVPAAALPPALRWLILTENRIENLPDEIGRRPRLQKLMLAGNRLRALPATMAGCHRLELLRIAANRFETLPDWLARLPRLAWLAFGGNPLERQQGPQPDAMVPDIEWQRLRLGPVLGQGASGVIHRAELDAGADSRAVAVKIFKGQVTSDGLPETEMAACIAAGRHTALVGSEARVTGHPDGRHVLQMALVDPRYQVLAQPPSLESCTRDVYPRDMQLDSRQALRIARCIASAAAHLHRRGLLHGDLYAHNILADNTGRAMLGDFGAASFVGAGPGIQVTEEACALQRLEVRAYGCLLEELRTLTAHCEGNVATEVMESLEAACLQEDPARRPLFAEIEKVLNRHQPPVVADQPRAADSGAHAFEA